MSAMVHAACRHAIGDPSQSNLGQVAPKIVDNIYRTLDTPETPQTLRTRTPNTFAEHFGPNKQQPQNHDGLKGPSNQRVLAHRGPSSRVALVATRQLKRLDAICYGCVKTWGATTGGATPRSLDEAVGQPQNFDSRCLSRAAASRDHTSTPPAHRGGTLSPITGTPGKPL